MSEPTTVPRLRLTLLGSLHVSLDDRPLHHRLAPSGQLLVAMLARRAGEPVSREELAARLWPDERDSVARANVRRCLYRVQRTLDGVDRRWLACDAKSITVLAGPAVWVDANEFERLGRSPATIEAALPLYGGDFLPYADNEWAAAERRRLRALACRLLESAVDRRRARGDWIGVVRYLAHLWDLDEWREDVVRDLIRARCRLGDRAGAVAIYRRFEQRVQQELGIAPLPETIRCYEEARHFALAS